MATVVHILDSRTGGSLVGHIKVGETYHQRKEVRSPAGRALSCPRPPYPQAAESSPAPRESCLAEAFSPTACSGVGLFNRPVPGSLSQVLSVWPNVPGSPKQPSAAQAPYGEGRAEEALFPRLFRLVPPGSRARCQQVLVLPGKGWDVISLPEERGLVWAVLLSGGDAQARSSQSVSRLHPCLLSVASLWSFG